jgi:hypothetical protein
LSDYNSSKIYEVSKLPCALVFLIIPKYIFNMAVEWFGLWCITPLSTIFQLYRGNDSQTVIQRYTYNKTTCIDLIPLKKTTH